jgi:hypothetical protein
VKAKEDYRQRAWQMLNGFRYNEWLESGEPPDEDNDHDVDQQHQREVGIRPMKMEERDAVTSSVCFLGTFRVEKVIVM